MIARLGDSSMRDESGTACYTVHDMTDAHHLPNVFSSIVATACRVVPGLSHVDPSKILVCVRKLPPTRLGETLGLRQAKARRGHDSVFSTMVVGGREILYVITFNVSLVSTSAPARQALETVMHELWHIAEECDGTIRPVRHGKRFNAAVADLHDAYVSIGGRLVPTFDDHARVRLRHLRGKGRPGVLSVRRGLSLILALPKAWKGEWTEEDVRERTTTLSKILPATFLYACPAGHSVTRYRVLKKPSSCAVCSPTFDRRFLLKRKTA